MENEEKFSEDPIENLRIENEFLKIKLKAQYGDSFFLQEGEGGTLPPEIENQFLKSIIQFEDASINADYITIYEKLGKPTYKPLAEMADSEVEPAIEQLTLALEAEGIFLDIMHGPYPPATIYTFITEELFTQEIEKEIALGGGWHFNYEEFHPNDKVEIEENTNRFFEHWFAKSFNEFSGELAYELVTDDGKEMDKETFYIKLYQFFDAFVQFKNYHYTIEEVSFEITDPQKGLGHAEGFVQYDAEMENGEIINYKGSFKLYMERDGIYWSIFNIVMPGFVW